MTTRSIPMLLLAAAWLTWPASALAVEVCHIPPGNPDDPRIIDVSLEAEHAHLGQHGDYRVSAEACDGRDNDCDLAVDEDFPDLGETCTSGIGACARTGSVVCSADQTSAVCDAVPAPPGVEFGACSDLVDNDCDGLVDCDDVDDCGFVSACTGCLSPRQPPSRFGRLIHGIDDETTPLAKVDPGCGELSYAYYANEGQDDVPVHILPDFSHAGYMQGGVAIPDVPVVLELSPEPGDNRARIQAAIDEVMQRPLDANGFRGAILLRRGTWEVDGDLIITAPADSPSPGGIVLRGEGQGRDGTVLMATRVYRPGEDPPPEEPDDPDDRLQRDLIVVQGGPRSGSDTRVRITSPIVPVGSRTFDVASTGDLEVGDVIAVERTPNQAWIDSRSVNEYLDDDDMPWTTARYTQIHERRIVAIEGNTLVVDIPIVDAIEDQYGGGSVSKLDITKRISQVGIEDLRMESVFSDDDPEDENHSRFAVHLRGATNSWVRRVTALHFWRGAVSINNQSSFNTVEEVAFLDPVSEVTGGRRYSFNIEDGTGNLFQRCFVRDGRHNFVSGSTVNGPNVWLDCLAIDNNADEGPHQRWATGLLFDNIRSDTVNVQNRRESGSGHGWAGAQTLFWNVFATSNGSDTLPEGRAGVKCDAPVGAMNWAVGVIGKKRDGYFADDEDYGIWESHLSRVAPRSLYLKQLEDRLGPDAVEAVTTPEQRAGTIWRMLRGWAGEGRLSAQTEPYVQCDGLPGGTSFCCAATCEQCGGQGCGDTGNAAGCCTGHILDSGKSCIDYPGPCIMP